MRQFINDGKRVGIIEQTFESADTDTLLAKLRSAIKIDVTSTDIISDSGETIARLQDEQKILREQLRYVVEEVHATQLFMNEQSAFHTRSV